ncbi:MAG: YcxB family protein [Planctomycetaceae bacterium]|nr:YcxB family protein [Planctomycetaceae bacterium]
MRVQASYSEALVKRTAMRFWVRYVGWRGFSAAAAMAALFLYLLSIGESSWYVPAFGTALAVLLLLECSFYFVNRHRALATLRQMAAPMATFDLSDAGISTESDLGRVQLSWRGITEVWTFPEAWLFFVAKGSYFTIPTQSLSDESRQLVRQMIIEHGGRFG